MIASQIMTASQNKSSRRRSEAFLSHLRRMTGGWHAAATDTQSTNAFQERSSHATCDTFREPHTSATVHPQALLCQVSKVADALTRDQAVMPALPIGISVAVGAAFMNQISTLHKEAHIAKELDE